METRKRKNQELVVIIENDIIVPHIKKEPIDFEESKHQANIETIDVNKQQIAIIENNIDVTNMKLKPNDMLIANIKKELDIEPIEVTLDNLYDNQIDIDENSITINIKEEPSELNSENEEDNKNYIIPIATVNIKQEKEELNSDKKTELACSIVHSDENFVTVKIEPDSIKEESLGATVKKEEEEDILIQDITDFSTENVVVRVETLTLIDCPYCPKKFLTEEYFQDHYKQEHSSKCLRCKNWSYNIKLCNKCSSTPLKKRPVMKRCGLSGSDPARGPGKQLQTPRDGKKWLIEYQKGNQGLVVENAEMNNVVYMFRCRDSSLSVRGKINGVVLDSCTKCAVVFDNLVSSVEFVNCQT